MTNVYCDMDGVLVDMLGGFKKATGQSFIECDQVDQETKWKPALKVPNFWEFLPKLHDADRLMSYFEWNIPLNKLFVLSAPQHFFPNCGVEKLRWLDRNAKVFPIRQSYIVPRKEKKQFAVCPQGKPNILIDDYVKNINEWTEAGGIGILHTDASTTIQRMREFYP